MSLSLLSLGVGSTLIDAKITFASATVLWFIQRQMQNRGIHKQQTKTNFAQFTHRFGDGDGIEWTVEMSPVGEGLSRQSDRHDATYMQTTSLRNLRV